VKLPFHLGITLIVAENRRIASNYGSSGRFPGIGDISAEVAKEPNDIIFQNDIFINRPVFTSSLFIISLAYILATVAGIMSIL
jgi:hypothetical protein